MRIRAHLFDFGRQMGIGTTRGPFEHWVRMRTKGRRRVSMKKRRRAINLLKAWALSTTKPRDRLRIIRRRLV